MASPSYVGAGTPTLSLNGSASIAVPTVSENDLLLLVVTCTYSDSTVTQPSGFTLIQEVDLNSVFAASIHVYYKIASGSEPATYDVSLAGSAQNYGSAQIFAWSGVDTTNPINVSAKTTYGGNSTSHVFPSVTTTVTDTTLIGVVTNIDLGATTWTAGSSGMTERADNAGGYGEDWALFDEAISASGATGTRTVTASASIEHHAITIALAPSAGGGGSTQPPRSMHHFNMLRRG
jgi:hypothetical protein